MRKWAGLGLGIWSCVAVWIGCGGSEETAPGGGGTDSGTDATTATDGSKAETSAPVDAPFDGFIDAPEVTLTFGTCDTFTPCGGDEKGSWKVSGGCLSDSFLAAAADACAGFTTSNETIKAKGIVTADGTTIIRRTEVKLTAKAFIPLSCAPGGFNNCNAIAAGAQFQYGFDKATCVANDAGDGCNCDIEETASENATDTYTKSGNTITTSDGETFDYCVAGSKLTYTQTSASGNQAPLPLFIELTK
jgi:hypothetical protein